MSNIILSAYESKHSNHILVTENIDARHRAWTGIAFNIAYPIGMIYLAVAAIFLPNWRDLQVALSVPVVMFVGFV